MFESKNKKPPALICLCCGGRVLRKNKVSSHLTDHQLVELAKHGESPSEAVRNLIDKVIEDSPF